MREYVSPSTPSARPQPCGTSVAPLNPCASEFVPKTASQASFPPRGAAAATAALATPAAAAAARTSGATPSAKHPKRGGKRSTNPCHSKIRREECPAGRHLRPPRSAQQVLAVDSRDEGVFASASSRSAPALPSERHRDGRGANRNRRGAATAVAGRNGRIRALQGDAGEGGVDGPRAGRASARIPRSGRSTPFRNGSTSHGRAAGDALPQDRSRFSRPMAQSSTTSQGQDSRKGRSGRRRPSRGGFSDSNDGYAHGDPPGISRPKRGAPTGETHLSGYARRRGHGRGRLATAVDAQSISPAGMADSEALSYVTGFRGISPSTFSVGRGEQETPERTPLSVPIPEKCEEEAFPALPPASGGGPRLAPPLDQPLPLESSTPGGALDYSSLAERLAEASAAEVARLSVRRDNASGGTALRLSVLPGFGEDRGGEMRRRSSGGGAPEENKESLSTNGFREDSDEPQKNPLPASLPLAVPSQPTLAAFNTKDKGSGSAAATAALRARLRERWFRLEAIRKAGRQREAAEGRLMAAEDRNSLGWDSPQGREFDDGDVGDGNDDTVVSRRKRNRHLGRCRGSSGGHLCVDGDGNEDNSSSSSSTSSSSSSSGRGDETDGLRRPPRAILPDMTTAELRPDSRRVRFGRNCDIINTPEGRTLPVASEGPRPMSAAGAAAIRRAKAAAELSTATATMISTGSASAVSPSIENPVGASPSVVSHVESVGRDSLMLPDTVTIDDDNNDSESDSVDRRSGDGRGSGCNNVVPTISTERAHAACEAGKGGVLNDLLVQTAGKAADGKDKLRRTPLHLAAEAGSVECVSLLLKQGTRLDQRDRWRETPLHKAARSGNPDVVKALCAARMKVNVRNRHRETPLLLAVRTGGADAVAALLAFGARPDDPDVNGVTPVCQAAMSGQAELLMTMANSNQACRKNSHRESTDPPTVVIGVADLGTFSRGSANATRRIPLSSLHHGSHKPTTGGGGLGKQGGAVPALSPIHEAAAAGQLETLSLLLQLGVSIEERDGTTGAAGDTPLGRAVRAGRLDCARLLMEAGAMVGRENARGETPLVVAIRAGQASAVELLARHGAPLDGGGSQRLASADGHAPSSAREKIVARRRVAPLKVALREGQLSCAAALIEGGARVSEQALRAVKLEPVMVAITPEQSRTQGARVRYAGTASPGDGNGGSSTNGIARGLTTSSAGNATTSAVLLPLEVDIIACMSPEIGYIADSAPLDGGGLEEDGGDTVAASHGWSPVEAGKGQRERAVDKEEVVKARPMGGLLPALGECDIILVLDDGSRLPVHSCLLAAFSGRFRHLFLCRNRSDGACAGRSIVPSRAMEESELATRDKGCVAGVSATAESQQDERLHARVRDVHAVLKPLRGASKTTNTPSSGSPVGSEWPLTAAAAAATAAVVAATCTSEGNPRRLHSPEVLAWGPERGEVFVRFWGAGTVAAIVKHVYSGRPPIEVHADGLGRLLAAAVSFQMPRLTKQVEHLLYSTLVPQKSGVKSAQHEAAARLLRAARALGATDLQSRCTLHLQANGVFPAVMKVRRELNIPSLNASDVARGLTSLNGSGYLGSGPAHAWSSSGTLSPLDALNARRGSARLNSGNYAEPGPAHAWSSSSVVPTSAASASVVVAKRAVDLSLRKRAVDFDQLVPLLLDPARCLTTLSIGRQMRAVLLTTALADASPGTQREAVSHESGEMQGQGVHAAHDHRHHVRLQRRSSCCDAPHIAVPLASNFSAFSHGMGWLLRTGAVPDVVLVLPAREDVTTELPAPQGGKEEAGQKGMQRKMSESESETHVHAHSVVLGSRSEKFAAMLRFIRRQGGSTVQVCDGDGDAGGLCKSSNGVCDCCHEHEGNTHADVCWDRADSRFQANARQQRYCRRDPPPRRLELHSPLLSPRSLRLFLVFLYTGVLDPGLSAGELSELALIADEYLVPDLTQQAETVLVEYLGSNGAGSCAPEHGNFDWSVTDQSTTGPASGSTREEDAGSMPLEVLQLGVSLGMKNLSVAAARAVLLQLDKVSRSEAFEASGMTKRELVVAALEAAHS